jgi:4'-phosphopantetheinyl transferase
MLSRSGTSTTPPASRKLFFCEHEARALELLPKPLSTGAFFECWARKEAFLKPTGEGLSRNLSSVAVTFFLPGSVPRFERIQDPDDDPTAWSLRSFIPAENYTAAVALRAPISELRLHLSGFEK